VDVNGKDPLVELSSEWMRSSDRQRSSERHRIRRRARKQNDVRAKIRMRIWLACTGALLVMAIVIYLAIGRERSNESGTRPGGALPAVAASTGRFGSRLSPG